jgi:SMODS and SLOG-associating 2TM effector domain
MPVASNLARTRGLDEPQESRLRARELEHLLHEVKSFAQDHGHESGDKWDDQINGFRLSLERILGNHQSSFKKGPLSLSYLDSNAGRENENWAGTITRQVLGEMGEHGILSVVT